MLDKLNEQLGGEKAWNDDLEIGLDRLASMTVLSYVIGFFPVQWALQLGILNDSPTQLFFAIYSSIGIITVGYLYYELHIEGRDEYEPVPFSVRGLLMYFMNLSGAFFIYLILRMLNVVGTVF